MSTTIAATATPAGIGGVGIIRLSGPAAMTIISRCLNHPKGGRDGLELPPRLATYGTFHGDDFTDGVIVIYFKAPHSFTGEDVIEIHAHGGQFILNKILEHLYTLGATPAAPGEFSRRAFLNGKISLDQAESIIDTIHAESESELRAANIIYAGKLKAEIAGLENSLVECLALIEATLDYPEQDIEHATIGQIKTILQPINQKVTDLIDTANQGRLIRGGIQIAVLGRPNVGKSSLFNALLSHDRSIVTNIAGTTTDVVSETILYRGQKLVFNDTAGIRGESAHRNQIETLGIDRTKRVITECDIALCIFDATATPTDEDNQILALVTSPNHPVGTPSKIIYVLNKADLVRDDATRRIWLDFIPKNSVVILTSAITGENITRLKDEIYNLIITKPNAAHDGVIITNARHLNELLNAKASLDAAITNLDDMPLDCAAADLASALAHLGNITGTNPTDAVLDQVFSRFCLGK